MPAIDVAEPITARSGQAEVWFQRVLLAFFIAAAILIAASFAVAFWAQNSFTGPECVVAAQSMMLARDGTLYYDLNHYPYTVSAYTPLFYLLESGLFRIGLPIYTAGRLLSLVAFLGICALVWHLVALYTGDRRCAWTGALACASSSLLLSWGTVGQVDVLAIFWALLAFYQASRYLVRGDHTLLWAAVFAGLAFFSKQTMLACPAAICVALAVRRPKVAIQFGLGLATAVGLICLSLNVALGGRFFADTVLANMNPFSSEKMWQQLRYSLLVLAPLLVVAAVGARKALKLGSRPLFIYLAAAAAVFAVTAPKLGSDLNYQMEMTVLLILCACSALQALGFFRLLLEGSRSWITLLQLPMAVFLVVNLRITANNLLVRFGAEQSARAELTALAPELSGSGRALSADYNALVRLRGRMDVEMLIYRLLVDAGKVDPEPVRRDLSAEAFSTLVLMQDASDRSVRLDPEISSLTDRQMDEVRKHYRLIKHISGAGDVYVYKPRGTS